MKIEIEETQASIETKIHCDMDHTKKLLIPQNDDFHQILLSEQLKVAIEGKQASIETKQKCDQANSDNLKIAHTYDGDQVPGMHQLELTINKPHGNIETKVDCCKDNTKNLFIAQADDEISEHSEVTRQVISILNLTIDSVVNLNDPASDLEEGELPDSEDEEKKKLVNNQTTVPSFDIRAVLDLDSDDDD